MREAKAAAIMAKMTPSTAQLVTTELARRRQFPETDAVKD